MSQESDIDNNSRDRLTPEQQELQAEHESGENEDIPYNYEISTYGVDYPVEVLVRKLQKKEFIIPNYQRNYVWNKAEASRLIESLLMDLPIPTIFLAKTNDEKFLVIDGQQRLKTLERFFTNQFPTDTESTKNFALQLGKGNPLHGKTYQDLAEKYQRRLDNAMIHITVVKQEKPDRSQSGIYLVFERLNSSGRVLAPQELRACMYMGEFNNQLKQLNQNQHWRAIYGKEDKRKKDEEYILRFYAYYYNRANYKTPYKKFMNEFMSAHKDGQGIDYQLFSRTIQLVYDAFNGEPKKAFRPFKVFNAACFDSVMVALAHKLSSNIELEPQRVKTLYDELLQNNTYKEYCKGPTANESFVEKRFHLAQQAFANL